MRILVTSIVDIKKAAHNRVHQFIKYLSQNHSLTVLSINDWWKWQQTDIKLYQQGFEHILQGVNLKYLTERRISPILQEVSSVIMLTMHRKEVDYERFNAHLNYNTLISGYFVARKMKSLGIETVYDIADDLPQMIRISPQLPPLLRPLGRLIGDIMLRKNINIARRITFTSNTLKNSYRIPESKSEHIPNGVDTELFKNYPSQRLKEQLGIHQDFVIGYVGVLREWVEFEPVFAALEALGENYPNLRVLVIGEEGGLEKTKDLARRHRISDKVIFSGTVPYTQVPEYISCMDICLIPRKPNPVSEKMLPLKLFEYMACEKPVISTRLRGIMEAVQNRVVYASTEKEYQEAIVKLYNREELRGEIGREGRRFVEKNYSWQSAASRLEEILKEVSRKGRR